MVEQENSCEVLVIGGGPAGSTIAALLAQRGRDVLMLEKSKHPRFHIGESLLPMNMPMFEELGLLEEIKRIGIVKLGAEFVSPWHPAPVMIDFNDALDNTWPSAYQVRRDEFDEVLFKNAAAKGARVVEECKVKDIQFLPGEGALVDTQDKDGNTQRIRARFVVDASGRDTFLSNHFQMKHRNKKHNSAAMFGHFSGVKRLEGEVEGNISLFWFDHGWFWFIPLPDGNTSIGATCWPYYMKTRKTDMTQFFMDTIAMCPALMERMQEAKLVSPVTATGNFSYLSERSSGENYILLGDAFAFIDPIFSSGVFLAMASSFAGADGGRALPEQAAGSGARPEGIRQGHHAGAQDILLVHLPHHHAGHAQPAHVQGHREQGQARADLHPDRRRVPHQSLCLLAVHVQGHVLRRFAASSEVQLHGLAQTQAFDPGRRDGRDGLICEVAAGNSDWHISMPGKSAHISKVTAGMC